MYSYSWYNWCNWSYDWCNWSHWCVCVWASKWEAEWMSEWMIESVSQSVNEYMREWVSGWMSEWASEWMSEWVNESLSECLRACKSKWVNEKVKEWMSEWGICVNNMNVSNTNHICYFILQFFQPRQWALLISILHHSCSPFQCPTLRCLPWFWLVILDSSFHRWFP